MASKVSALAAAAITAVLSAGLLAGCAGLPKPFKRGGDQAKATELAAPRLGVNAYLWRASLETLDFMPMSEIDPFGGVILSEWYSNPEVPGERFKTSVYILDTQLRADALKVSVFKQLASSGTWADAPVDADTARKIENAILTRARELYIASN